MKRIITIVLSAILTIAVSAQEKNPVEKICEEIYSIVPGLPRLDTKAKAYVGSGQVSYSHTANFSPRFWAKDSIDHQEILKKMLYIIRHNLDSLMEFSEESDLFESHYNDADTIKYSICLSNGSFIPPKHKIGDSTYITPDDKETISFLYTKNKRNNVYRRYSDFVQLAYGKNIILPNKQDQEFAKLAYLEKITPVLKRKDIKSWNFKWSLPEDYDTRMPDEDILYTSVISTCKSVGRAIGTMYFIPKEKKELAEAVLTSLDSITLSYTETNPNQIYTYIYNMKDRVMRYTDAIWGDFTDMFTIIDSNNYLSSMHVFYGKSSQGYYIAVADTENNFCIPKEWYCLKSFDNGKKEYIKGAKK